MQAPDVDAARRPLELDVGDAADAPALAASAADRRRCRATEAFAAARARCSVLRLAPSQPPDRISSGMDTIATTNARISTPIKRDVGQLAVDLVAQVRTVVHQHQERAKRDGQHERGECRAEQRERQRVAAEDGNDQRDDEHHEEHQVEARRVVGRLVLAPFPAEALGDVVARRPATPRARRPGS